MKIFFKKLFAFALILALCDFAVGLAGNYLVEHAVGGDTVRKNYIVNKTSEDILIFGSSRATHHYDPSILEDSLGKSVYNCGFDGEGILCEYGIYRMIAERYTPSVIIYDVSTDFDLMSCDNHRFLGRLRLFYDQPGISEIFEDVDKTEKLKMVSSMYRYNSALPLLLLENIIPFYADDKGFRPIDAEMGKGARPLPQYDDHEYDSLKIAYLEKLINDCKGKTQLIFAVSPYYANTSSKVLEPIVSLCDKYDVPLIDNFSNPTFNQVPDYFSEPNHLNRAGATAYSKYMAGKLKQYLDDSKGNMNK